MRCADDRIAQFESAAAICCSCIPQSSVCRGAPNRDSGRQRAAAVAAATMRGIRTNTVARMPGQGRPVRVSPSHQLPSSATIPAKRRSALQRSQSCCLDTNRRAGFGRRRLTRARQRLRRYVVAASSRSSSIASRKSGWSTSPTSWTAGRVAMLVVGGYHQVARSCFANRGFAVLDQLVERRGDCRPRALRTGNLDR